MQVLTASCEPVFAMTGKEALGLYLECHSTYLLFRDSALSSFICAEDFCANISILLMEGVVFFFIFTFWVRLIASRIRFFMSRKVRQTSLNVVAAVNTTLR